MSRKDVPKAIQETTDQWKSWAQQEIYFRDHLKKGGMQRLEDLLQALTSACLSEALRSEDRGQKKKKWVELREQVETALFSCRKLRYK